MSTQVDFQKRLGTLERQHKAMANGYKTQVRGDGLIVIKPRRVRRGLPWRGLLLLAVGFIAFKAFMLASLGEATYGDRVTALRNGTLTEQLGAWVMQPDPLTVTFAAMIAPVI